MRKLALLSVLIFAGCTQWGTSALRTVDIWWACPDRHLACSEVDSLLTFAQMDNRLKAVSRDLCRFEASGKLSDKHLEPLRGKLAESRSARAAVEMPPLWGERLADYVQAVVSAERIAEKHYGRVYGYGAWNGWKPNEAQRVCQ